VTRKDHNNNTIDSYNENGNDENRDSTTPLSQSR